jgi:hypothetical protein
MATWSRGLQSGVRDTSYRARKLAKKDHFMINTDFILYVDYSII